VFGCKLSWPDLNYLLLECLEEATRYFSEVDRDLNPEPQIRNLSERS
jgi:hypothetical protein